MNDLPKAIYMYILWDLLGWLRLGEAVAPLLPSRIVGPGLCETRALTPGFSCDKIGVCVCVCVCVLNGVEAIRRAPLSLRRREFGACPHPVLPRL